MPVEIKNLTNRPVLLRLNSGNTMHLAPSKISTQILDVEVNNNSKVQKLKDRKIISLHPVIKKPIAGRKKVKSKPTKRKK